MNFTDIFVGGSPSLISENFDLAKNISGCVGLSTVAELNPIPLQCTAENDVIDCSLCSNEVSVDGPPYTLIMSNICSLYVYYV